MVLVSYIICIDGSSKRQITKATLLRTCTLHTSNCCIAYSPRGLRMHIRIGISFVVATCEVGWFMVGTLASAMLRLGCLWLAAELGGLACL